MTISLIRRNSEQEDKSAKYLTVLQFIDDSRNMLEAAGMDEARLTSELILCEVLGCERMNLYLDFEKPLNSDELRLSYEYLERRLRSEPLQYIFRKSNFYGFDFYVDERVLIPRPETEILVQSVIEKIKVSGKKKIEILEIGTGSGCIALTLAKLLDEASVEYEINSIDVSPDALEVARMNKVNLSPFRGKVSFHVKDLFSIPSLKRSVDYIVSNPPYVSKSEYAGLSDDVRNYEPGLALTDNADGLTFFRKLLELVSGQEFRGELYCEIGYGQEIKLTAILAEMNFTNFSFMNDDSGVKRILNVRI